MALSEFTPRAAAKDRYAVTRAHFGADEDLWEQVKTIARENDARERTSGNLDTAINAVLSVNQANAENSNYSLYVAHTPGNRTVRGFAVHETTVDDDTTIYILDLVVVAPSFRRQGVAQRLLEHFFFEEGYRRRFVEGAVNQLRLTPCSAEMAQLCIFIGVAFWYENADESGLLYSYPAAVLHPNPLIAWDLVNLPETRTLHELGADFRRTHRFKPLSTTTASLINIMRAYGLEPTAMTTCDNADLINEYVEGSKKWLTAM